MRTAATKNSIAVAILALVAVALGVIYFSGKQLGKGLQGPTKIGRGADGTLWVVSHGALHQLSPDGKRRQTVSLQAFGLGPIVSAVLPLADGTVVLAQAEPSAAHRCDPAARRCAALTSKLASKLGATRHALMIAADEEAQRLVISDNAGHRLILLDFDGNVLDVTTGRRVLYPNELRVERSGEVTVADTNHHRLVRISLAGDRFGADLWELPTARSGLQRPGRIWPMGFAHLTNGEWWVLNARDGMKDADLLTFSDDGKARRRVDLDADADPTGIVAIGDDVLLADPIRAELTLIGPRGEVTRSWGDAEFNRELAALRTSRANWGTARLAAQLSIAVLPLIGIALLWRLGDRPAAHRAPMSPAQDVAEVAGGTYWIGTHPEFLRRARTMTIGLAAVNAGIVLSMFYLFDVQSALGALPKALSASLVAVLALALLAPLLMLIRPPRAWRQRLGTDGERFFFDPGNGKAEAWPFSSLATDGRRLLAGTRLIVLTAPAGRVFPEEDVRRYVFARMPSSGRVSAWQLFVRALNQGNREMWFVVIVSAAAFVAAILPALVFSHGGYLRLILQRF